MTYHFFELDVITLEQDWLERAERQREWVDYAEAIRRLQWKRELAQGLESSTLNSCRRTKVFGAQRSDCCLEDSRRPQQAFVTNVIGSMAPLCGQRDSCTKSSTVVLSPWPCPWLYPPSDSQGSWDTPLATKKNRSIYESWLQAYFISFDNGLHFWLFSPRARQLEIEIISPILLPTLHLFTANLHL